MMRKPVTIPDKLDYLIDNILDTPLFQQFELEFTKDGPINPAGSLQSILYLPSNSPNWMNLQMIINGCDENSFTYRFISPDGGYSRLLYAKLMKVKFQ